MQNRTLDIPQGKLIFRTEDGLLHAINEQAELLLQAFRMGFTVDNICNHFEEDAPLADCRNELTALWQQWQSLNLSDTEKNTGLQSPHQLLICPGLEVIKIITNSQPLHSYLKHFYRDIDATEHQIMSTIEIQQAKTGDSYQIIIDGHNKCQANSFEGVILATSFEIGEKSTHEEPRLFVAHAAALTNDQSTWLLPAAAGSGKSTLTATLLKHNYRLINDDVVPVNHDGTVTALNLPLKIKSGAWPTLEPLYSELEQTEIILRAGELRMKNLAVPKTALCPAGSTHHVSGIAVPIFDPNLREPKYEALSPIQKTQALLHAEPYFTHHLTRPYLKKILDWLDPIPAWEIRYSSSEQALQLLKELIHQK